MLKTGRESPGARQALHAGPAFCEGAIHTSGRNTRPRRQLGRSAVTEIRPRNSYSQALQPATFQYRKVDFTQGWSTLPATPRPSFLLQSDANPTWLFQSGRVRPGLPLWEPAGLQHSPLAVPRMAASAPGCTSSPICRLELSWPMPGSAAEELAGRPGILRPFLQVPLSSRLLQHRKQQPVCWRNRLPEKEKCGITSKVLGSLTRC